MPVRRRDRAALVASTAALLAATHGCSGDTFSGSSGPDASTADAEPSSSPCTRRHAYCVDFEPPRGADGLTAEQQAGAIALDPTVGSRSSSSARAELSGTATEERADWLFALPIVTSATVAFDLRVDATPATNGIDVMAFRGVDASGNTYELDVTLRDGAAMITDADSELGAQLTPVVIAPLPAARPSPWIHFEVAIAIGPAGNAGAHDVAFSAKQDGGTAANGTATMRRTPVSFGVRLGVAYAAGGVAQVHVDDIVIDASP